MGGQEDDARGMASCEVGEVDGIWINDQGASHFERSCRVLLRSVAVENRNNRSNDEELEQCYEQMYKLEDEGAKQSQKLKGILEVGGDREGDSQKLKSIQDQYSELFKGMKALQDKRTGKIAMPDLNAQECLIAASNAAPSISILHHPSSYLSQSFWKTLSTTIIV
ncbi:hypothetical protein M422DRAFT_276067 [Sphaerobolus stellatus SS14]|uniref:Uncharacterized protein n=1 Tax=Sphaerobolus stellatus (strain SS14) TaxID=990650 RepID=A0A0C9UD94_SPHS4|nr:hypothetical protein M422DRAFT_276067 [Sphaerobolus stellatus SS14]